MPAATLTTAWEDFEVPAHARGGQVTLNLYDHLASYLPKRPAAYLRRDRVAADNQPTVPSRNRSSKVLSADPTSRAIRLGVVDSSRLLFNSTPQSANVSHSASWAWPSARLTGSRRWFGPGTAGQGCRRCRKGG